jgi:ribosomal protein L40E
MGVNIMNEASVDLIVGTYYDDEDYTMGFYMAAAGGAIGLLGFCIMMFGLIAGKEQPKQVVVPAQPYYPPPQQPMYPPPQAYQAPPPQYAPPPPQHQVAQPVYPQAQPPMQQPPPQQAQPVQVQKVQPIVCETCGNKNSAVAKFCNECGGSLKVTTAPSKPEVVEEVLGEPLETVSFIKCISCGHQNMKDAKYCNKCAEPL